MTAYHATLTDHGEVVDTRETVTGTTYYVIKDDDGHHKDVTEDGTEITPYPLGRPGDTGVNDIIQTDPDGARYITNDEIERLTDRASTIVGLLPDGTRTAVLCYDTLVWPHYNDDYENYQETPLEKAFHRFAAGDDDLLTVNAHRYYRADSDTELAHGHGALERVTLTDTDVPHRDRDTLKRRCLGLLESGDLPVPAPVIFSKNSAAVYTHEHYVDALADRFAAEYRT